MIVKMKRYQTAPLIQNQSADYEAVGSIDESFSSINTKSWVENHVINVEVVPVAVPISGSSDIPKYRDTPFAIAFLLHLLAILLVGALYGSFDIETLPGDNVTSSSENNNTTVEYDMPTALYIQRVLTYMALPCGAVAFLTSNFITGVVLPLSPEGVVKLGLLSNIPSSIAFSVALMASYSSPFMVVVAFFMVGFAVYYVIAVWRFVPFTACNLMMGVTGVNQNYGIYFVALFLSFISLAWITFWSYTMNGVIQTFGGVGVQSNYDDGCDGDDDTCGSNGSPYYMTLLVFSLYWTSVVLMNITQTTVAGLMGTWCFDKESASKCCSNAVSSSLFRACTYSFGSICFGSLLNAIIMILRYMVQQAEQNRDNDNLACSIILCITQCILAIIESIIEYFNRWAYIFVGVYGMSYLESGKAVLELFEARGLTAIISDDISSSVLNSITLFSGLCAGIIGVGINGYFGGAFFFGDTAESYKATPFWISFLAGVIISSIMMSVIQGAVKTIIVCYADNPNKLLENHREETTKMTEAWKSVYPNVSFYSSIVTEHPVVNA